MFEKYDVYKITVGTPTITVSKNGVGFNKQAIVKLGYSNYIRILINREENKVAILASEDKTDDSHEFCLNKVKPINIRLNYKDFTSTLYALTKKSISARGFRVEGEYLAEYKAVVFDFNNIQLID